MSEEAELPPDYEEVVNSQTTQMDCTASTLIQRVHYHVGKSEGEVNLPGLTSTDPPPSYPFEGHTTATSPSSGLSHLLRHIILPPSLCISTFVIVNTLMQCFTPLKQRLLSKRTPF